MISIMVGIIKVIHLFTNRFVFGKSLALASSKRSSSCFSRLNARITGIPVRISLCYQVQFVDQSLQDAVNLGIATWNSTIDHNQDQCRLLRPRIHVMDASVFSTRSTPPTPRIGA